MALSGVLLNAVTSTGPGPTFMFHIPVQTFTIYTSSTGSPTVWLTNLEGTLDGVNYFTLVASGQGLFNSVGHPVVGIRANLIQLSGGTSPTVTAWFAAA